MFWCAYVTEYAHNKPKTSESHLPVSSSVALPTGSVTNDHHKDLGISLLLWFEGFAEEMNGQKTVTLSYTSLPNFDIYKRLQ